MAVMSQPKLSWISARMMHGNSNCNCPIPNSTNATGVRPCSYSRPHVRLRSQCRATLRLPCRRDFISHIRQRQGSSYFHPWLIVGADWQRVWQHRYLLARAAKQEDSAEEQTEESMKSYTRATSGEKAHKGPRVADLSRPRHDSEAPHAVELPHHEAHKDLTANTDAMGMDTCYMECLSPVMSLAEAVQSLLHAISDLPECCRIYESGIIRFEVPFPSSMGALSWLRSQPNTSPLFPRVFFSPRMAREGSPGEESMENGGSNSGIEGTGIFDVAGVGSAMTFHSEEPFSFEDWKSIQRFLSDDAPNIRAFGCMRFDPQSEPSPEWSGFGAYYFTIPQVEISEHACGHRLACTVIWENDKPHNLEVSTANAINVLNLIVSSVPEQSTKAGGVQITDKIHTPDEEVWHETIERTLESFHQSCKGESETELLTLRRLLQPSFNIDAMPLTKVVMARRTRLKAADPVDPLWLLSLLKEKDPSAYQFCIQIPNRKAFISGTPERLFVREKLAVASEAVAGTRPRCGNSKKDLKSAFELILSSKDHNEFEIVRESIRSNMLRVCKSVGVEVHKKVLKQARVQHLYGRLNGELYNELDEFELMMGLHPTPAVCGHPQGLAMQAIRDNESFDRGMYAGPVGYFGGPRSEFAVGIRSALVSGKSVRGLEGGEVRSVNGFEDDTAPTRSAPKQGPSAPTPAYASAPARSPADRNDNDVIDKEENEVILYAGVGVIKGSVASSEWKELDLKISQFETCMTPVRRLSDSKSINELWASMLIEECVRLGHKHFCIAPGSRSSQLAAAVALHPQAHYICCIDERSLAFHAIGYGRATNTPAVVITTSGTAVANLLPAVVEASQDSIPLILLTADRPAELRDTRANQTIDQVKLFEGYVRYQFDLPPPDHKIPARFVLTTLDTAAYHSVAAPAGPVHINCQFREPLALISEPWPKESCMSLLEQWEESGKPFTSHIPAPTTTVTAIATTTGFGGSVSDAPVYSPEFQEVLNLMLGARQGLLIVGALRTEEERWRITSLAKWLGWPTVADVLSGIRLGSALEEEKEGVKGIPDENGHMSDSVLSRPHIIHYFDQVLLCKDAYPVLAPDVILQVGGTVTMINRMTAFLKAKPPSAYVFVKEDPRRHDESHLVTHRVCMNLGSFVSALTSSSINGSSPASMQCYESKAYCQAHVILSQAVGTALVQRIESTTELTEPWIARAAALSVHAEAALFVGNSMPVRDLNMYGDGGSQDGKMGLRQSHGPKGAADTVFTESSGSTQKSDETETSATTMWIAANRGASGIDGVLSTATGFAAGLQRPVTLLVGDVSFIYDTNGLLLLQNRVGQPPLVTIVVNNNGGAIFSMLPVVDTLPAAVFDSIFSTPHDVRIGDLCRAHRINHALVSSKEEFGEALTMARQSRAHWVIEAVTGIKDNTQFRRELSEAAVKAGEKALNALSFWEKGVDRQKSVKPSQEVVMPRIANISYHRYRVPLHNPPTSLCSNNAQQVHVKEGFLISIKLQGVGTGIGEVAPLGGLHTESLDEAEEQLRLLIPGLHGASLNPSLSLADGSLETWLTDNCILQPNHLYPSVRCGLEMAVLTALASFCTTSLSELLLGSDLSSFSYDSETEPASPVISGSLAGVRDITSDGGSGKHQRGGNAVVICGLLDGTSTPEETARAAAQLVSNGFSTIKLKVARRADPSEDVAVVKAVRRAIGPGIKLRADANRKWSLQKAVDFGNGVRDCELQYLEEPVSSFADVEAFFNATGIPVALDESVDEGLVGIQSAENAQNGYPAGTVALVLKPGRIGGVERTLQMARWAIEQGLQPVISSAFESSIGLSAYAEIARVVDLERKLVVKNECDTDGGVGEYGGDTRIAHGLGTFPWIQEDVVTEGRWSLRGCGDGFQSEDILNDLEATRPVIRKQSKRRQDYTGNENENENENEHGMVDVLTTEVFRTSIEVCMMQTKEILRSPQLNPNTVTACSGSSVGEAEKRVVDVNTAVGKYSFSCLERKPQISHVTDKAEKLVRHPTLVFLHGFLGRASDWLPLMDALSVSLRCIAIDLPGHGASVVSAQGTSDFCVPCRRPVGQEGPENSSFDENGSSRAERDAWKMNALSMESVAEAVAVLIKTEIDAPCVVVGYSMGARLAMYMATKYPAVVDAAAVISGSPGIAREEDRARRLAKDFTKAAILKADGVRAFVKAWYKHPLWKSLRGHRSFPSMMRSREDGADAEALADVLVAMSTGKQPSLWEDLARSSTASLLLIAGAKDKKFVALARSMYSSCFNAEASNGGSATCTRAAIEGFGKGPESDLPQAAADRQTTQAENVIDVEGNQVQVRRQAEPAHYQDQNVQILEVPDCGHAVHLEKPEVLVRALRQFASGRKMGTSP